jgi:rhodanese-related sulfurtransferase
MRPRVTLLAELESRQAGTPDNTRQSIVHMIFGPKAPAVTVSALHGLLKSGDKYFLLDVRTRAEFDEAHVAVTNALIPYDQLDLFVGRLPEDKKTPIYCICRSGRRSAFSTNFLRSIGYEQAFNVTGGILAWIKAGYPTNSGSESGGGGEQPKDFFSLA